MLKELNYTCLEVSEFTNLSESMIKKIRSGKKKGSFETEDKIMEFVRYKINKLIEIMQKHPVALIPKFTEF